MPPPLSVKWGEVQLDAPALASMICGDFDNAHGNIQILRKQFDCHRIGKFESFLVLAAQFLNHVSVELLSATKEPPVLLLYQERHLEAVDSYKRKWTSHLKEENKK